MNALMTHPRFGVLAEDPVARVLRLKVSTESAIQELWERLEPHIDTIVDCIGTFSDYPYDDDKERRWAETWRRMPTYSNRRESAFAFLQFYIRRGSEAIWSDILGQRVAPSRKRTDDAGFVHGRDQSVFRFPASDAQCNLPRMRFRSTESIQPRYPVYIVSKGRHESRRTSRALEAIGVPYHIAVEPSEYDAYCAAISPSRILKLPFQDLGCGSIPARNWVWEHAMRAGHARHWVLDDNIAAFYGRNLGVRHRMETGNFFRAAEDYVDRFTNVALAGFNYRQFIPEGRQFCPVRVNTRIYSCILVRNNLAHRWRDLYNEDTDLSLRVLKDGACTLLFNAFLIDKAATMTMKGGNTDGVYASGDARLEFARSLQHKHPDVVKVVARYGRWHHHVDYRPFAANALVEDTRDDCGNFPSDGEHVSHGYGIRLEHV